jgi:hypothetical protein
VWCWISLLIILIIGFYLCKKKGVNLTLSDSLSTSMMLLLHEMQFDVSDGAESQSRWVSLKVKIGVALIYWMSINSSGSRKLWEPF